MSYSNTAKPTGVNFLGAYSALITYEANDSVSYSGSNYVCILQSLNHAPTNETYWVIDDYSNGTKPTTSYSNSTKP